MILIGKLHFLALPSSHQWNEVQIFNLILFHICIHVHPSFSTSLSVFRSCCFRQYHTSSIFPAQLNFFSSFPGKRFHPRAPSSLSASIWSRFVSSIFLHFREKGCEHSNLTARRHTNTHNTKCFYTRRGANHWAFTPHALKDKMLQRFLFFFDWSPLQHFKLSA